MRLMTLMLTLFLGSAQAGELARGLVFLDANGNGRSDGNEHGIADVGVSNGRDVVRTDEAGRYALTVGDGDVVFVIKPSGYHVPLKAHKLPSFYYVHKPNGSPVLRYRGVDPTGPLPPSVDFPLLPGDGDERFSILVVADPQPGVQREVDYLQRDVVAELAGHNEFRFGVTLGDIVFGTLSLFESVASTLGTIGIPWINVIGNHDINIDGATQVESEATFNRQFGPSTFAFNEGKVHFLVLNCVIHPVGKDLKHYGGGFTERQFQFIANDLRYVPKDWRVVVLMHYPLFELGGKPPAFSRKDRRRLFELINDFPFTLSLSGHTHFQSQWYFGEDEGWSGAEPHHHFNVGTASGDWWRGELDAAGIPDATMRDGTPNGYATIQFDGVRYLVDYKVARAPADFRMSVSAPPHVTPPERAEQSFYVNYFLGSTRTRAEFRSGDGPWVPMTQVFEPDPVSLLNWNTWPGKDAARTNCRFA